MNDHEQNLIEKASYYASKEIVVHLSLVGERFYNGLIVDVNDMRILLLDKKLGEVYVPIGEINEVSPFREAGA